VIGELERLQVGDPAAEALIGAPPDVTILEAAEAVPEPAVALPPVAPAAPLVVAPVVATPNPPVLHIDDDQRAILEAARSAVVAVNREGHPPQLTTAAILWDGETARFLTLGWARRTTLLRADPAIGLLVEGPGDGRFVTVAGRARIVEGRDARDAALPLLLRGTEGDEAAAAGAWDALLGEDADRAVIVIEPDQVLSGRR
jgi:hypothetical protein